MGSGFSHLPTSCTYVMVVLQLEDVGDSIEKIRIGHDGSGFASGWHLNKVEIRKLLDTGKVSTRSCKN